MKKISIGILLAAIIGLGACSHDRSPYSSQYDPDHPGYVYEFEGDMYYSVPYDPLSQWENHFIRFNKDSMNMRLPVKGTIARGKLAYYYPYANTAEGYEMAGAELKNPVPASEENLAEGKRLFETYCWHCHGKEGKGDGPVIASGAFPAPSWKSYDSKYIRELPVGKMYHTITYGRNLMGSHASQLAPDQRWRIINYIKFLAFANAGAAAADAATPAASDSTAAKPAEAAKDAKAEPVKDAKEAKKDKKGKN